MQYDLGLDAAFLNNRLTFTLDYYNKVTDDILLNLDIPAVLGLKPSPQNAGTVLNRGWEFSANYQQRPSAPGAFAYQLNANFSINHNEVTDLKGTGPYIAGSDIDPRYIIAKGLRSIPFGDIRPTVSFSLRRKLKLWCYVCHQYEAWRCEICGFEWRRYNQCK
jgi:outer membrane receptor protein involved in Fe transport